MDTIPSQRILTSTQNLTALPASIPLATAMAKMKTRTQHCKSNGERCVSKKARFDDSKFSQPNLNGQRATMHMWLNCTYATPLLWIGRLSHITRAAEKRYQVILRTWLLSEKVNDIQKADMSNVKEAFEVYRCLT